MAIQNGLPGFYFVGQTTDMSKISAIFQLGFDGVNHCHRLDNIFQYNNKMTLGMRFFNLCRKIFRFPLLFLTNMQLSIVFFC